MPSYILRTIDQECKQMTTEFTEVFAIPGQSSIIDGIHPVTGLSLICGETLEQVRERHPGAQRMQWEDWRAARAAEQNSPVEWLASDAEQYHEMLNILPPAAWVAGAFLVGEPTDHDMATGCARFQMYRHRGEAYEASSRPVTVREFRAFTTR